MSNFTSMIFKKVGISHQSNSKGCEDFIETRYQEDICTIALSDGAGSASFAAQGAKIVCTTATKLMTEQFDFLYQLEQQHLARYLLKEINKKIDIQAKEDKAHSYDYLATLLVAAFKEDGRYILFHVGDGVLIGMNKYNQCKVISAYDHEIALNLTTFVQLENTPYFIEKGKNRYVSIFLMSDGAEECMVRKELINPRIPFFMQLSFFMDSKTLKEYMKKLAQYAINKGSIDDISFAILSNQKCLGSVFEHLDRSIQKSVLGFEPNEKQMSYMVPVLNILERNQKGIDEKQLIPIVKGSHWAKVLHKKLRPLVDSGLIQHSNHRYFIID